MQALFDVLKTDDFEFESQTDENGHLTALFFIHKQSLELCRRFRNVFVFDCTYKTNKLNLPLMNITGISATFPSFNAGFVFLQNETHEMYEWCLTKVEAAWGFQPKVMASDNEKALINACETLWKNTTNLLCVWHVNKNVLKNTKPHFTGENAKEKHDEFMEAWGKCISSGTMNAFETAWLALKTQYAEYPRCINYIEDNVLTNKHKIVSAYTNQFMHLGTSATSRGESAHWVAKRGAPLHTRDVLGFQRHIKTVLAVQFNELTAQMAMQRNNTKFNHDSDPLKVLVGNVSVEALKMVRNQMEGKVSEDEPCTNVFTTVWGLPCRHKIQGFEASGVPIPMSAIDKQWHLTMDPVDHAPPQGDELPRIVDDCLANMGLRAENRLVLRKEFIDRVRNSRKRLRDFDPTQVRNKGRNRGGNNRDPSAHEIGRNGRRNNRCKGCQGVGHNIRACPEKNSEGIVMSQINGVNMVQTSRGPDF